MLRRCCTLGYFPALFLLIHLVSALHTLVRPRVFPFFFALGIRHRLDIYGLPLLAVTIDGNRQILRTRTLIVVVVVPQLRKGIDAGQLYLHRRRLRFGRGLAVVAAGNGDFRRVVQRVGLARIKLRQRIRHPHKGVLVNLREFVELRLVVVLQQRHRRGFSVRRWIALLVLFHAQHHRAVFLRRRIRQRHRVRLVARRRACHVPAHIAVVRRVLARIRQHRFQIRRQVGRNRLVLQNPIFVGFNVEIYIVCTVACVLRRLRHRSDIRIGVDRGLQRVAPQ